MTKFTLIFDAMKAKEEIKINIKELALKAFIIVFTIFVFYIALVPNK